MPVNADIRKLSVGMVIIIAMITVLLPLCMAISCDMGMTGMSGMTGSSVLGFNADCVDVMTGGAQAAIAPGSQQSIILTLVAALAVMFVLAFPPAAMRSIRVVAEDPPAPPDDPRGVRLII